MSPTRSPFHLGNCEGKGKEMENRKERKREGKKSLSSLNFLSSPSTSFVFETQNKNVENA